jgi:DNA-binding beta-propeller fold protein YncE
MPEYGRLSRRGSGLMRTVVAGRMRVVPAVLAVALLSLALVAPTAVAGKGVVGVFGSSGSGDGQFAYAGSTAVNTTSGDVYVVDQLDNRVEQFDASGSFIRAWGWGVADGNPAFETCSSNCQAGQAGSGDGQLDTPQGIAVDQSDGAVYVVDGNNSRVEKFDSSGAYLSQFGSAGSAEGQFAGPQGIAVDPTDGSVYVADAGNNRVQKFDSTGTFTTMFGFGVADGNITFETCTSSCQPGLAVGDDGGFSGPTRVAVDSSGQVYVLDSGNGRIERYTAASAFDQVFDPTDVNVNTFPFEIAVGPGNDHLYVAQAAPDYSEQRVFEIDAAGTLIDTHGVGSTASNASGLSLNAGSQKIYLADGFNARVFILDDLPAPTVSVNPATNVTADSADVSGTVNPNGPPDVGWHFEISTDDANWSPVAADENAGSGTSDVPVSASLTGLLPDTTYFVRLVATRQFNAPTISNEIQFTTAAIAPDVTTRPAQDLAPAHATLRGVIHPHNSPTTYYFEYGPTTSYGTSVPASQDADAGSANFPVAAIQAVYGLQPGTTYHYRLVAHNAGGAETGDDQTFTTTTPPAASTPRPGIPGSGFLPDDRAWEQVSPPDKQGGEIMGDTGRTRAASREQPGSPMAATFASLTGFDDVHGTGISSEYMAIRTADTAANPTGWTTHGITPRQDPGTMLGAFRGFEPLWQGELSSDLSRGVFRAWSPLSDTPNVAAVENLYLRTDLRTPGAGLYRLLTDCPACAAPLPPISQSSQLPAFVGASRDFSHVIFQSRYRLLPGATATLTHPNLYEWVNGTLRLAGVLPDDACGSPPCVAASSIVGQGKDTYTPHAISEDGSRIFFTDNSATGGARGTLYMRVNGTSTVKISGDQPATFWTTSSDGTRIFFTTAEQLASNDTDSVGDVYMYDVNAPGGQHLTRLSISHSSVDPPADADGVIGASDDGHYVYFVKGGQLVAGEPSSRTGIYEWHDGTVSFVGELAAGTQDLVNDVPTGSSFTPLASRVTPDGQHLLFMSHSGLGLTGYDQSHCDVGCAELYVYSADTHELACASCNPSGAPATSDARNNQRFGTGGAVTTLHFNHPFSDDGRHAFFTTAERLVREDTNGKRDVYEYDVPSGTVHLLSSGKPDTSDTYFMEASKDGSDAFFITRQQLVGWDTDLSYDLYDARVGGGFPDPVAVPGCQGEGCLPSQPSAPGAAVPGSGLVSGPGNVPAKHGAGHKKKRRLRCRHGYVKRRVRGKLRCVKRVRHHRKAR